MDSNVASIIANLSNNEADATETARFYVDVLALLATYPLLVKSAAVTQTSGAVPQPADAVAVHAAFWNNYQLGELSIREADWLAPDWREATGTPYSFVRESLAGTTLQLVPAPTSGTGNEIYSYTTDTLPTWLQMPVALLVLALEYERESDHQNLPLAGACRSLGMFMLAIIARG